MSTFSDSVYEMLVAAHERTGKPWSEILRDAIVLEKWLLDETERQRLPGAEPKREIV
jgi:hypothetical protein